MTETESLKSKDEWTKLLVHKEDELEKEYSDPDAEAPSAKPVLDAFKGSEAELRTALIDALATRGDYEEDDWKQITAAATVLYHLRRQSSDTNWSPEIRALWNAAEYCGKDYPDDAKALKKRKFPLDAIFFALERLQPDSTERIKRFLNSSMADDWKAFYVWWDVIFRRGNFDEGLSEYLSNSEDDQKSEFFRVLAYRLRKRGELGGIERAVGLLKQHKREIPDSESLRNDIYEALTAHLE